MVSGLAITLFCVSLAIPATKHGKDCLGIEFFTMGLFCIFGHEKSPSGSERQLMSLFSHLIHVSALISIFIVWNRIEVDLPWKLLLCS